MPKVILNGPERSLPPRLLSADGAWKENQAYEAGNSEL